MFVPIVLTMDEAEHAPLLEEWLARQQVSEGAIWRAQRQALQGDTAEHVLQGYLMHPGEHPANYILASILDICTVPLLEQAHCALQVQSGPNCCSDEEALARVRLLQDHFCTYQVPICRYVLTMVHVQTVNPCE